MTENLTLQAVTLLGDLLEEKEAELSIQGTDQELDSLNQLWQVYSELLDSI